MYKKKSVPLFKIDLETRLATPFMDSDAMWVLNPDVHHFVKIDIDGRFVRIKNSGYYFLYDWKPRTTAIRAAKLAHGYSWHMCSFNSEDFNPLPDSAFPCDPLDPVTGYAPYWYPAYHLHGYEYLRQAMAIYDDHPVRDGTYELVGPKIQGNPYGLITYYLIPYYVFHPTDVPKLNFSAIKDWFGSNYEEGITWHHKDGSISRVKRKDFGLSWPTPQAKWSEEKLSMLIE